VRTPRFIQRVAQRFQRAIHTSRLPRNADLPPMMDQLMAKLDPVVLRNHLLQILLDFHRIILLGQFEPPRQPPNVRVDDDPGRNAEPAAEDHVCGLSRDSSIVSGTFPPNCSTNTFAAP